MNDLTKNILLWVVIVMVMVVVFSRYVPTGAEPQEQPSTRDRLQRRRHVGENAGLTVGDVEHQRAEHHAAGDLGERGEDRPRLRHPGARVVVGIPQMVPGPQPVEPRLLGGERGGAHVGPACAHRDEEQVRLHGALVPESIIRP